MDLVMFVELSTIENNEWNIKKNATNILTLITSEIASLTKVVCVFVDMTSFEVHN